jgi:TolB protein
LLLSDLERITYHGSEDNDHLTHSHDYEEAIQLYLVNAGAGIFEGERTRLSPEAGVDDGLPAWSPDGEWIAFGRKLPRTQNGRQLWLMRPDGSEARALTDDPAVQHGPPHWSPDGRYLLFQRYRLLEPGSLPEICILDVENGEIVQVAVNAYLPTWLPSTNKLSLTQQ